MRFSHALVRDALYEDLSPARRVTLHRRAGEVLEHVYRDDFEPHLAELAHHFTEAAEPGEAQKASGYARRAGDRATRLFAHEEAARLYEIALRALDLRGGGDERSRCELLLSFGEAQARSGRAPDARATFLTASDMAARLRLPEHQARAALGHGGRYVHQSDLGYPRLVPLLEAALDSIGPGDSDLRARLLARLAGAVRYSAPRRRRLELSEQAVEMARRLGDPDTIGYVLGARALATWAADNAVERVALGTEMIHLAEATGDLERLHQGHMFRVHSFLELGDVDSALSELAIGDRLTEQLRQPPQRWYAEGVRPTLALMQGRWDEAERLMGEMSILGGRLDMWQAGSVNALQRFLLARERGGTGELAALEEMVVRAVDEYPWYPLWRCVLVNLRSAAGPRDVARSALAELAADGWGALDFGEEWLLSVALLAEACAALDDGERAATLYELLAPFADGNVIGTLEIGLGSAARYLGLLAATMSDLPAALAHLDHAIAANERMGARPWTAHAREDKARVLAAAGLPEEAAALARAAADVYDELGMATHRERARGLARAGQGRGASRGRA